MDKHNQRPTDLHEQFTALKKCSGKFECRIYEMLLIRKKRTILNTQNGSSPRKYVFWVRHTEFWWSAVHLTKTTKCQQPSVVFALSLDDSEKSSKLRVHTVNLAFKLRSLVG